MRFILNFMHYKTQYLPFFFNFLSAGNEMKPSLHLSWTNCLGVLCNLSCRLHVDRNHAAASVSFVSA